MWNPFSKNNTQNNSSDENKSKQEVPGMENMGFMQRLAMKKFMSMSDAEKAKMMQKLMTPENIAKNRDKIVEAMEQMKKSGMISDDQIREAKRRFGI